MSRGGAEEEGKGRKKEEGRRFLVWRASFLGEGEATREILERILREKGKTPATRRRRTSWKHLLFCLLVNKLFRYGFCLLFSPSCYGISLFVLCMNFRP